MYSNVVDNQNKLFFDQMFKNPILPPDVQLELIRKAKQNDIEARNQLILSNSKLVLKCANCYTETSIPLMDLFEVGIFGLVKAINLFDETKSNRFSTYAVIWIHEEIKRYIAKNLRLVRLPRRLQDAISTVQKLKNDYYKENGEFPTDEYLIETYNNLEHTCQLTIELYNTMLIASKELKSLNEPVIKLDEVSDEALENFVADNNTSLEDSISNSINQEFIKDILLGKIKSPLTDREKSILSYRFGFLDNEPKTLVEISKIFKLTKERIRIIQNNALKKLSTWDTFRECYQEQISKEKIIIK